MPNRNNSFSSNLPFAIDCICALPVLGRCYKMYLKYSIVQRHNISWLNGNSWCKLKSDSIVLILNYEILSHHGNNKKLLQFYQYCFTHIKKCKACMHSTRQWKFCYWWHRLNAIVTFRNDLLTCFRIFLVRPKKMTFRTKNIIVTMQYIGLIFVRLCTHVSLARKKDTKNDLLVKFRSLFSISS